MGYERNSIIFTFSGLMCIIVDLLVHTKIVISAKVNYILKKFTQLIWKIEVLNDLLLVSLDGTQFYDITFINIPRKLISMSRWSHLFLLPGSISKYNLRDLNLNLKVSKLNLFEKMFKLILMIFFFCKKKWIHNWLKTRFLM